MNGKLELCWSGVDWIGGKCIGMELCLVKIRDQHQPLAFILHKEW